VVVGSVPLTDVVASEVVGAALLSVVRVVLSAAALVVGAVVGAAGVVVGAAGVVVGAAGVVVGAAVTRSLVTDPRRLDKILASPVLSMVVEVAAADETEVVGKMPVEAAPLIPAAVVVGSKDTTKEESKDESSSGVVLVAAAEADVVVEASEVVVAASEVVVAGSEAVEAAAAVVGTRTLDMSDTIELSKLLRPRPEALLVVDAAVDPPVPENDTPDVTLESEVVVGAAGFVVLELVVKMPPGPKVIPPSVDAAAEDVVGTKALVSVIDDVGAIITAGSKPVDPTGGSLVVVVVGVGVGSIPTTVVC
jgi:hypothetical protein